MIQNCMVFDHHIHGCGKKFSRGIQKIFSTPHTIGFGKIFFRRPWPHCRPICCYKQKERYIQKTGQNGSMLVCKLRLNDEDDSVCLYMENIFSTCYCHVSNTVAMYEMMFKRSFVVWKQRMKHSFVSSFKCNLQHNMHLWVRLHWTDLPKFNNSVLFQNRNLSWLLVLTLSRNHLSVNRKL